MRFHRATGVETVSVASRGARMIHGIASTAHPVRKRDYARSLIPSGCMCRLPIPLLSEHSKFARSVGEVFLLRKTPTEIYVRASLHDDSEAADFAWRLIEDGELRAFSVSTEMAPDKYRLQAEVDGVRFFDLWWIKEVSLVRRPGNPDSRFEIFTATAMGSHPGAVAAAGACGVLHAPAVRGS
jgi:hypothetical protein